jgi:hypothetical protein
LQTLPFLRGALHFEDFARMATNERIHPAATDWNFYLSSAVILYFCFPDWCTLLDFLLNPVENLLFTIGVKSEMLPSLSWQLQSMRECRLQRTSWAIECSHQRIDRNRNVLFSFCDITNLKNLLAPKLKLLEGRVFAKDFAQISSDAKFCEVC